MYSEDKKEMALQVYNQCGCVTTTIRLLGYPTQKGRGKCKGHVDYVGFNVLTTVIWYSGSMCGYKL